MGLFGNKKHDVVVVAMKMAQSGEIDWLRGFERRGPTWSDWVMIPRAEAVDRIRAGERFATGERVPYQAGTFITYDPIRLEQRDGVDRLVSGSANEPGDALARVPIL